MILCGLNTYADSAITARNQANTTLNTIPSLLSQSTPNSSERYRTPLDEYPRRCVYQIKRWKSDREKYVSGNVSHKRTMEYASYIMESLTTDIPYKIGGNVLNNGLIDNLPREACVEVASSLQQVWHSTDENGPLPTVLAAMNMTNINAQLLTIEAAITRKKEAIYQAACLIRILPPSFQSTISSLCVMSFTRYTMQAAGCHEYK